MPITSQRQPDNNTCLVTAFSMIVDVPVVDLIREIGHDGSTDELGHHVQEIAFVLWKRGYAITQFDAWPCISLGHMITDLHNDAGFSVMLANHSGVITGFRKSRKHAMAWDTNNFVDPANGKSFVAPMDFVIQSFYVVSKRDEIKSSAHDVETNQRIG